MNHIGTISLETTRLVLRRIYSDDAEEIYEGFVNQDEFLYYANKEKRTLEEEIKSLENINSKYENKEYYNWVITLKETGAIIGSINLRVENKNDSVEFNYAIDNRYINKGYMTEALSKVKEFALDILNVNRFQGGCVVENIASKRVMEKCKMNLEGVLKSYIKLNDGYHDMYMFSNVRGE